jgi:uncharacterized membrane protein
LLGRALLNLFVGLFDSLLVALRPEHICYSQEARLCSLPVLLVIAPTCVLALANRNPSSTRLHIAQEKLLRAIPGECMMRRISEDADG